MRILLVAATTFEIRPFVEKLPLLTKMSEQLSHYRYKNIDIDVLIPGVGMIPTAYFLGRQLALQHYHLAINAGIAGTFNRSLSLGSVVNVVEDCVAELGAEDGDKFLSVFDLGLIDPEVHPYQHGILINDFMYETTLIKPERINKLPKVKGITSNTVHGNIQSIARVQQLAKAELESMEGAAFLFACLTEKIPCLQLRAISNLVEERDKKTWKLDLALKNLNRLLFDLLIDI